MEIKPDFYVGNNLIVLQKGTVTILCEKYIIEILRKIEINYGKLSKEKVQTSPDGHLEFDKSSFFDKNGIRKF